MSYKRNDKVFFRIFKEGSIVHNGRIIKTDHYVLTNGEIFNVTKAYNDFEIYDIGVYYRRELVDFHENISSDDILDLEELQREDITDFLGAGWIKTP